MSFFKKLFGMSERIKEETGVLQEKPVNIKEEPCVLQEIKVKQLKEYLGKYYGKNIKNKKISKECKTLKISFIIDEHKIIQEIETITFFMKDKWFYSYLENILKIKLNMDNKVECRVIKDEIEIRI